jgi:hypothetical protein
MPANLLADDDSKLSETEELLNILHNERENLLRITKATLKMMSKGRKQRKRLRKMIKLNLKAIGELSPEWKQILRDISDKVIRSITSEVIKEDINILPLRTIFDWNEQ